MLKGIYWFVWFFFFCPLFWQIRLLYDIVCPYCAEGNSGYDCYWHIEVIFSIVAFVYWLDISVNLQLSSTLYRLFQPHWPKPLANIRWHVRYSKMLILRREHITHSNFVPTRSGILFLRLVAFESGSKHKFRL